MRKEVVFAIGIFTCVFFAGYIYHAQKKINSFRESVISKIGSDADVIIKDIQHTSLTDGKKNWYLKADQGWYDNNNKELRLINLSAVFYADDGSKSYLSADEGTYFTRTNDLEAIGNVSITYEQNRLKTQHVIYRNSEKQISTDKPVAVKGEAFNISANAMIYKINEKTAYFQNGVVSRFIKSELPIPKK